MTTVRGAEPSDRDAIARVHTEAFGRPDEARLVAALEGSAAWVPGLSLVAEQDGEVVGHVLFSLISIVDEGGTPPGGVYFVPAEGATARPDTARPVAGGSSSSALCLAPMAVLPEHQRRGVGAALITAGLAKAEQLGHETVVVVGHPDYYRRFGFRPARPLGLTLPFPAPDAAFMVLALNPFGLAGVRGRLVFPAPFADID